MENKKFIMMDKGELLLIDTMENCKAFCEEFKFDIRRMHFMDWIPPEQIRKEEEDDANN